MPGLSLKEDINKKVTLYFGTFPIYDQHKPQITAESAPRGNTLHLFINQEKSMRTQICFSGEAP